MNPSYVDDDLVYTLDVVGSFLYSGRLTSYSSTKVLFRTGVDLINRVYFLTSAVTSIIDGIFPVISLTKCINVFVTFENVK